MRVKDSHYRLTFWELFGRKKRDEAIENPNTMRKTNFILIFRWCGQKKSISVIMWCD